MVLSTATTLSFVSFAKNTTKTHPYPTINLNGRKAIALFEILIPANRRLVYFFDNRLHARTVCSFGLWSDFTSEPFHTLLTRPPFIIFEVIAEKVKTFYLTIDDLRLFRVRG